MSDLPKARRDNTRCPSLLAQVAGLQGWCCYYCGVKLSRSTVSKDHKLPRSKGGGGYDVDNIAAACVPCNLRKGNMTAAEFLKFLGRDYSLEPEPIAGPIVRKPRIKGPRVSEHLKEIMLSPGKYEGLPSPMHGDQVCVPKKKKRRKKRKNRIVAAQAGMGMGWPDGAWQVGD